MLVRERQDTDPHEGPDRPDADPRRRAARRGVVGALAGALIMLAAASALAATGQDVSFLGLSSSERGSGEAPGGLFSGGTDDPPPLTTDPGRCVTWNRGDGADVREVDCASPHLFETVGRATASQPPGAPFPGDAAWQQLVDQQCTPMARTYLQNKLDPNGRYRAGALKPTPQAWAGGDRTVRCGLQAPGRTGALFTSTGRVADADQAVVFDAGTCLGRAGKEVSDPVDCGRTHAAEVAGTVDLGTQFRSGGNADQGFPSIDNQDNYLQPTCQRIAEQHMGGAQKLTDSRLTVYWTNVSEESWNVGTRRVGCNLGALLADGSGFAPLVGAAKDGVRVLDAAPPEPEPLPEAGSPAGRAATGGVDPGSTAEGSESAESSAEPDVPGGGTQAPVAPPAQSTQEPSRPAEPSVPSVPSVPSLPSLPSLPGPLGGN